MCGIFMSMCVASAVAMEVTNTKVVLGVKPKMSEGNTNAVVKDLDGKKLRFQVIDVDTNVPLQRWWIKFTSKDKKEDYFSFPIGYRSGVTEITTKNPDKKFWIIESVVGESSWNCIGFWIIGKYGDSYVNYVSLDSLIQAGLGPNNLVFHVNNDGTIKVIQQHRNYGDEIRKNGGRMFNTIKTVTLFWDDQAQWWGIRS